MQASAPPEKPSTTTIRTWIYRALMALTLPVLLFSVAEYTLRVAGYGYSADLLIPCTIQGQPAACYNLFFPAPFFPPGMIKAPQAYAIRAQKASGTYRIFVLGESAAMGDPDPAYSFSRYLEVMLRESYPGRDFEVVNTGSVAINSHVLLPIAKGLAFQKPDLFIIYSGNNEVVGPYGPGTALTSSGMQMSVIRSSILFHTTRIGQLITKLGTPKREWGGMEMFLDKQVPASSPLMKNVYANYESNLRETIAAAQKSGARVIVSTVATNLKDCAPFASMHREGISAADLRAFDELLKQGADLEENRSFSEALTIYHAAAKIDAQYAELEFRIARCLSALGDPSARDYFMRARDLDSLRFRADSRINEINRSVPIAMGAEVVDADRILGSVTSDRVTGNEMVYEHVHLTPEGNYELARAMFLTIAAKLSPAADQPAVLSQHQCEQLLAFTPHDRLRLVNEILGRLQRPPFTNQLNHSEQVLRLSMMAQEPDPAPQQTVAEYEWAIQRAPGDRPLHYNFGLFLFDFNPNAAAEELRRSRPWDDFPVFAPNGVPL